MSTLLNNSFFSNLEIDGPAPSAVDSRSLESGPITAASLLAYTGGVTTRSGADISEQSALTMSAVWAAVRVLSQAIATLPLKVRKTTDKGSIEAREHPAYKLLTYRPNPYMSAFTFFDTLMGHVVLWGNAYARIMWGGGGQATQILPLAPNDIRVERVNGVLQYRVSSSGNVYTSDEIIHIPGPGFDGIRGYSVIGFAREELGLGKAVQQFGSDYFGNGASVKGVLQVPGSMKPEERIAMGETFDRQYSGKYGNKTAVLANGATYNKMGIPPEDSQFLESRRFSVQDVARWFGVPVHMLGDLERATFSNIEEQNLWFLQSTVTPWATRIEQEFDYKLFGFNNALFCSFDETQLRRADLAKRQSFYASGRQWGYLRVNEIREWEGLEQVEGGDVLLQPVNMAEAGSTPPEPSGTPPEPAPADATPEDHPTEPVPKARSIDTMEPVLLDAIARMNRKERNIRERHTGEKLVAHLAEHRTHLAESLTPALKVLGLEPIAQQFAEMQRDGDTIDDAADLARLKGLLQ